MTKLLQSISNIYIFWLRVSLDILHKYIHVDEAMIKHTPT